MRFLHVAAGCFALVATTSAAYGDGSAADMAAARALGTEGIKLANRGNESVAGGCHTRLSQPRPKASIIGISAKR